MIIFWLIKKLYHSVGKHDWCFMIKPIDSTFVVLELKDLTLLVLGLIESCFQGNSSQFDDWDQGHHLGIYPPNLWLMREHFNNLIIMNPGNYQNIYLFIKGFIFL